MMCRMCDTEIAPGGDASAFMVDGANFHLVCSFRAACGSTGHHLGLCSCNLCNGPGVMDLPGLTRYEAALQAWRVFRVLQRLDRAGRLEMQAVATMAHANGQLASFVAGMTRADEELSDAG